MYLFIDIIGDILQGILCQRHLHFRQWLLHCLSDIPSYKTVRIWNVFYKFFPIPSSSFMESLFFSSSSLAVA